MSYLNYTFHPKLGTSNYMHIGLIYCFVSSLSSWLIISRAIPLNLYRYCFLFYLIITLFQYMNSWYWISSRLISTLICAIFAISIGFDFHNKIIHTIGMYLILIRYRNLLRVRQKAFFNIIAYENDLERWHKIDRQLVAVIFSFSILPCVFQLFHIHRRHILKKANLLISLLRIL